MVRGGIGGANTNATGLAFEKEVDLIKNINLRIVEMDISLEDSGNQIHQLKDNSEEGIIIAKIFKKHKLYDFLINEIADFDWNTKISKQLLPDNVLVNLRNNKVYIIEVKNQTGSGSVDEKLQTCDFKRKQYIKLFEDTNYQIEYIYVLSNFFQDPKYSDVLEYIQDVECHYFFGFTDDLFNLFQLND